MRRIETGVVGKKTFASPLNPSAPLYPFSPLSAIAPSGGAIFTLDFSIVADN